MNEITKIHLGRQAFTIAVDAHKQLRDYLAAVKRHSHGNEDVVEEVEMRMAELLTERGVTADKVVLAKDVDYLKGQLGEPGDFDDDETGEGKEAKAGAEDEAPRRLFRDTEHGMVAGVAAGLANYFQIDPVITRIAFVVATLAGGWGILIYIILWLIVPEAKTPSDTLQMHGKPVTVDTLKGLAGQVDVPGATRRAGAQVGSVVMGLMKLVLVVVGIGLVALGLCMFIAASVAAAYGLINGVQVGSAALFPVGREQVAVLVCGFVLAALVALLVTISGLALVRRKWPLPGWAVAAVVGVFVAAASLGTAFGFDTAPAVKARYESFYTTRAYTLAQPVTQIHFRGDRAAYEVRHGDHPGLVIRTFGKRDAGSIKFSQDKAGVLTVDSSSYRMGDGCTWVCPFADGTSAKVVVEVGTDQPVAADAPDGADVEFINVTPKDGMFRDGAKELMALPELPSKIYR
ncbi:MAG TPA: PspC domain-containing protein [Candidatus Saccharimonadales bacterium]|nr:PspC domain-containing protein [Candidatus Saccharimonadales bacterium]